MLNSKETNTVQVDEAEMKKINEEMITSDLITPDRIYVDLVLFKDVNISTILSFLKERQSSISHEEYAETYNKIMATLPEYNKRAFDDFEHLFSFTKVTNEQIKERLHDERASHWILHHAPVTKYIDVMRAQIAVNVNHSAVKGKRDPIEMTINTYPLHLSKEDQVVVGFFFSDTYGVNTRVIYLNPKDAKLRTVLQYDEMYTYHLKEFFDAEEINKGYSELKFIKKRLFAAAIFGDKFIPNKGTEQEGLYLKSYLDMLTNFTFVPPRLFSAPPIAKESTENG